MRRGPLWHLARGVRRDQASDECCHEDAADRYEEYRNERVVSTNQQGGDAQASDGEGDGEGIEPSPRAPTGGPRPNDTADCVATQLPWARLPWHRREAVARTGSWSMSSPLSRSTASARRSSLPPRAVGTAARNNGPSFTPVRNGGRRPSIRRSSSQPAAAEHSGRGSERTASLRRRPRGRRTAGSRRLARV
jgi:hypothetical protein